METLLNPPLLAAPGAAWWQVLHRVNPALSWTGWLNVVLAALALALLLLDPRHLGGALLWWKPLKFSLSIVAFAWTLAWLLADLPGPAQRSVAIISTGVAVAMAVEQAVIFVQAARGTTSHYNVSSALNGVLFGLMGVFIFVNTVLTAWAVYLSFAYRPFGPAGYVWGLRLGLGLFLVGSVLGGFMIGRGQHTVGAADGGPGLPGLGWSTRAGDLRIAHFLGMHALQVLPLLGWLCSRFAGSYAVLLTWAGAAAYAAVVAALFGWALLGRPLGG